MQGQSGLRPIFQNPTVQSLGIFLFALLPRLSAIGRYVTPDEPIWVHRSLNFREALLTADWAATLQSGHPGVTLTWLGTLSVQLQLWLQPQSREHLTWLNQLYWLSPDNGPAFQHLSTFLTAARLGPIILTSLGLVAAFWLLRAKLGKGIAFYSIVLLAFEPFTAGLSGLFHLDALLATFMLLAVLVILPAQDQPTAPINRWQTVLCGLFTALAILTKTPGLFLLPFIFLILVWRTFQPSSAPLSILDKLRQLFQPTLLWVGTILFIILLLLPAVWAAPGTVFETVGGLANRLSDNAVRPIFFLGQETLNPGPTFYPLVLAFRLSPIVSIGLLLSAVFALQYLFTQRFGKSVINNPSSQQRFAKSLAQRFGKSVINNPTSQRRFAKSTANYIWLLLFSLGFLFFLNLSAKRFDRYALPAILPLVIISAVSYAIIHAKLRSTNRLFAFVIALVLLQTSYYQTYAPFHLTAYNWLAGGPTAAQKTFPTGWGEETSTAAKLVADYFFDDPNQAFYTNNIPAAAAFYPGPLLPINTRTLSRIQADDYIHFVPQDWQSVNAASDQDYSYLTSAIRNLITQENITDFEQGKLLTGLTPPDFRLAAYQSAPQNIRFEEKIAILSAGAIPAAWPNQIQIGIEWQRLQTAESNYFFRLDLVDQTGEIWLTQEDILLNAVDHPLRYWPADQPQQVFYTFSAPSHLAPGPYSVQLTLFDDQGHRLGIFTSDGRFAGVTAPLAAITMPAPIAQLPVEPTNLTNTQTELTGYDPLPITIGTGEPLKLDLWWRQMAQTPLSASLRLVVGSETAETPLSTAGWISPQIYQIRPAWTVPAGLESGSYPISLQLLDQNGRPQWPTPIELGQMEIVARSRRFELPPDLDPLQIQLGTVAYLQEAAVEVTDEAILFNVIWQAVEPDGIFYTTFLHLLDETGNTVAQGDRPSIEPSHTWISGQVIQEQYQLNRPPDGTYTITIGLYDQTNGLRLPIYAPDGRQLPNDQYLIEVTIP